MQAHHLIRMNELASRPGQKGVIPVSNATLWRWIKDGKFPAPIRLSGRVTAFEVEKVNAWIKSQAEGGQQ